jgi:hypothetical protein
MLTVVPRAPPDDDGEPRRTAHRKLGAGRHSIRSPNLLIPATLTRVSRRMRTSRSPALSNCPAIMRLMSSSSGVSAQDELAEHRQQR